MFLKLSYENKEFVNIFKRDFAGVLSRYREQKVITSTLLKYYFKSFLKVMVIYRRSHRRCSIRKGVLKNFAKFTGKHLCRIALFHEIAGLRPATLLKRAL